MKVFLIYILFIVMLIFTFALGAFFSNQMTKDVLKQKAVIISPQDKRFIEDNEVMALINPKDSLLGRIDIQKIEEKLVANPYIANAEVYKDLNNHLYASIEQYKPIARIIGQNSYYLDINGHKRPLSKHYTENVILVFGNINQKQQSEIYELIKKINKDSLLSKIVTEIWVKKGKYTLKTKNLPAQIILGDTNDISTKLDKLKIIYLYLIQHKLNHKYHRLNLEYNKQVVCN